MSIRFEDVLNKVKITLSDGVGRGYSIFADTREEAVNSLKHYWLMKHNRRKCPSCRDKR